MARPTSSDRSEATIAEGTTIRGRVSGEGTLRVQGRIEGDVSLRGELHVEAAGRLVSTIEASAVTIEGDVQGSITAGGNVTVVRGARLVGDVAAARFQLDEGAEFAGSLAHDFDLPTALQDKAGGSKPSFSDRASRRR